MCLVMCSTKSLSVSNPLAQTPQMAVQSFNKGSLARVSFMLNMTWPLGCSIKSKMLSRILLLCTWLSIYLTKHQQKFQSFPANILAGPAIFRNTKEIPKNTKENRYRFCFGHTFLTISAINLIPWQVIYIFPTLSIDTQLGHNYGH